MKVSHSYRIFQLRQLSNKYNAKRVDDSYVPKRFIFTKTGDSPTGIKVSLNDTDDIIKKLRIYLSYRVMTKGTFVSAFFFYIKVY